MVNFRITESAQQDIVQVLARSEQSFGAQARERYEALLAAAIRDASAQTFDLNLYRPELGHGVFVWHLARSRGHSQGGLVRRPRHLLVCRREGDVLIVGRVLHESMDLPRHTGN
ncbi:MULTISPECIES: type II toxin-antitoxin system RelE/ParE family toxin [unclassified Brachybacterium]|uniref:type II toxin-antitoxin system RelE/ParE family toxin n=1 Tax=unclassified Brachybacterium TaxID=2623841 RepID=UPI0040336EFB